MNLAPTISKRKFTEEMFFGIPVIENKHIDSEQMIMIPARGNGKSHYQMKLIEAMLEGKLSLPRGRRR